MFRDHPLIGLGHGVYRTEAAAYYPAGASKTWLIDAHNLPLHVAAETGIVGLIGFFGALLWALARVVRRVRRDRLSGAPQAVLDRTALFGLTVILVLGVTHFPLHHAPVALAFWTLLGVAGGAERTDG
jgi:O-antigen ligase